jgi:hypothetical protein
VEEVVAEAVEAEAEAVVAEVVEEVVAEAVEAEAEAVVAEVVEAVVVAVGTDTRPLVRSRSGDCRTSSATTLRSGAERPWSTFWMWITHCYQGS